MPYDRLKFHPTPEYLTRQTWLIVGYAHGQLRGLQESIRAAKQHAVAARAVERSMMNDLYGGALHDGNVFVPYSIPLEDAGRNISEWQTLRSGMEATFQGIDAFWRQQLGQLLRGRLVQAVASDENDRGFDVWSSRGFPGVTVGSVRGVYHHVDLVQATIYLGSSRGGVRVPLFVPGDMDRPLADIEVC